MSSLLALLVLENQFLGVGDAHLRFVVVCSFNHLGDFSRLDSVPQFLRVPIYVFRGPLVISIRHRRLLSK